MRCCAPTPGDMPGLVNQLPFQAQLGPSVFQPTQPISLTLHHLDFRYHFSKSKVSDLTISLLNKLISYHTGQMAVCSIKMRLLGELEYLKILTLNVALD